MLREGKELSEVESKADQMLYRVILGKISATSKGNSDFSKLIELKERYKKDDPFLIYKLTHRGLNNQPTYVLKTSGVLVDTGKKLDRAGDHYLSSSYVHFDGNEKRVNNMRTLTLSMYHQLIRKEIILATLNCEGENKENAELFWKHEVQKIRVPVLRAAIGKPWRMCMVKSCCIVVTHASFILSKVSLEG